MSKDEPLLSNCPLETAEPSRNYARVPGYKKKYKKKTRKRREKKRKMKGVEINTSAYVATRLLLRWDYLYAVTLKTKVFGDYNHAPLEVSWITSTLTPSHVPQSCSHAHTIQCYCRDRFLFLLPLGWISLSPVFCQACAELKITY